MLMMKPNCETCGTPLPPETRDAVICSYECTFCSACAEKVHAHVCPNCGGELRARPTRIKAPA